MIPIAEELESPPPNPRIYFPVPPTRSHVWQSAEGNNFEYRRKRPNTFSYFKFFFVVLGSQLVALSMILCISWPSTRSAFSGPFSCLRSSRRNISIPGYGELTLNFSFAAYEAQSAPNRCIKPDFISSVSLQTEIEKLIDDLSSNSFTGSLKRAEIEMRDLSQWTQYSSLPNRARLAVQLSLIASTAKSSGRNFQRFLSSVRGTLDQIIVMNEDILREVHMGLASSSNDGSSRPAPAFLKLEISRLLRETNATASDLVELQAKLNFASDMAAQLRQDYARQKDRNSPPAYMPGLWVHQKVLADLDDGRRLLNDIRAELERASSRVESQLSLLQRISNDLHVVHDQFSATIKTSV